MKIQPLYDLQQEINRLFIAGSKFAKGDPRLTKHIPVLQKLGEKAPVFRKLAVDIEELVTIEPQQSSDKLIAVSTLLYSVLYTQGETIEEGLEQQPQVPVASLENINTERSYVELKPVIKALTESNSGRLDIIREAYGRGVFNDFRTFRYLDYALADKYSELADYVERIIIPSVGVLILPFLLQNFSYEDKMEHVRRFRLLSRLKYSRIDEITNRIFEENLPLLQAEAIIVLSEDTANEEMIINLTGDKNKKVREAAYMGLVHLNTPDALKKLVELYVSPKGARNKESLVNALSLSPLPYYFDEIFSRIRETFDAIIALDKKSCTDEEICGKTEALINGLIILRNKQRPEVTEFLSTLLTHNGFNALFETRRKALTSAKISYYQNWMSGWGYNHFWAVPVCMVNILTDLDKHTAIKFYEDHINLKTFPEKNPLWEGFFKLAVKAYSRERVYDVFADVYKKKILDIQLLFNEYRNEMRGNVAGYAYYTFHTEYIDPRWTDILYGYFKTPILGKKKAGAGQWEALQLLHAIEPNGSKKLDKALPDMLPEGTNIYERALYYHILMDRKQSDRFKIICDGIAVKPTFYPYALRQWSELGFWKQFPKEYAAKFRQIGGYINSGYSHTDKEFYESIAQEIENQ